MLTKNFINTLREYINIVDILHLHQFNQNFNLLKDQLIQTKKEVYAPKDFYVIKHNPGYLDEFKLLIPDRLHQYGLPIVFDDCISAFYNNHLDTPTWNNIGINSDKIEKHALTMMGSGRVHRNALYNHIKKHNYFDMIATANQGNNES
mgnify:CR=1 FL=1